MLPYAGKASITSFKYSLFIDIVKKLKQWSQSAGNTFIDFVLFFWMDFSNLCSIKFSKQKILKEKQEKFHPKKLGGAWIILRDLKSKSETLKTIRNNTEKIKNISIHLPTHLKPLNDEEFGHYLAGLIDGDGHFSSKQQLVIVFSSPDVQLAYYIKKIIGFGHINKVKDKNAYLYIISNKEGIIKTINLINGKLRTKNKFNQVIDNILVHPNYSKQKIEFKMKNSGNLKNYWIAGFSDADASFQIKIIYRDDKPLPEIRLNYQIDQKDNSILLLIKEIFGGNIGYRSSQDTYYYGSTSFGSAKKVIKYLDNFSLQSTKHNNYLKWRQAYRIIQSKNHLTKTGVDKIWKLKNSMNRNSV